MNEKVYVETTIVSYLTAWPSRDLILAGHQQITHDWWNSRRRDFHLCASQLVLQEAAAGDTQAAEERLKVLQDVEILVTSETAIDLAKRLIRSGALPAKAASDALHIAIAAAEGICYLLTWNCRHIANATMRPWIEATCAEHGIRAPVICTPEELMENKP